MPTPHTTTPAPMAPTDLAARNWRATVELIVSVVETEAVPVRMPDRSVWHDIRPLISADEQPPEMVDRNRELIELGVEMRVLCRSQAPNLQHLVHINGAP